MKNFRLNIILLLALVCGAAAAYGVFQYLNSVKAFYLEQGDFVQVVVAARYIPPKTQITSPMYTVQEIPAKYVNDDAAVDPKEITGKLTKTAIYPQEQILRSKIVDKDDPPEELAFVIPEGERAVTVAVNEVSGIAGMIRPGDRVDVLVTFDAGSETITSLLLQNIKVLATDRDMDAAARGGKQDKIYQTVTLSVSPRQAQPLVMASEQGSIRLMLRSPADQETEDIPSTRIRDLIR